MGGDLDHDLRTEEVEARRLQAQKSGPESTFPSELPIDIIRNTYEAADKLADEAAEAEAKANKSNVFDLDRRRRLAGN